MCGLAIFFYGTEGERVGNERGIATFGPCEALAPRVIIFAGRSRPARSTESLSWRPRWGGSGPSGIKKPPEMGSGGSHELVSVARDTLIFPQGVMHVNRYLDDFRPISVSGE